MILNIFSIVLLALLGTTNAQNMTDDKVADMSVLPGWPSNLTYDVYSGFIDIKNTSKKIHYVLVEAQANKSDAPLVIWFNGGPGCSSMLGLLQETGPYVLLDNMTTYSKNEHAWNKEANMLYIEQPAGVGYSYCDQINHPEDCHHNDTSSMKDNLEVLLGFFDRFSNMSYLRTNGVFIAGESYAGIYVPLLSYWVNEHNKQLNDTNHTEYINLNGFMVGNGVTNWTYDTANATLDVAFYRSLIPLSLYDEIHEKQCNFSGYNDEYLTEDCKPLSDAMSAPFGAGGPGGVDIYNIYGKCWNWKGNTTNFTSTDMRNKLYGQYVSKSGKVHEYKKFYSALDYTPWVKGLGLKDNADYGIPGCIYALPAAEHLNNATVKKALHVDEVTDGPWLMCKGGAGFSYDKDAQASQWAYELLRDDHEIRMMHFSGDMDASVPTIGTERWVNNLGWNVTSDWQPFISPDNSSVGGYYEKLDGNMTLITVHGAGHMVPQDQRETAYYILFNWVFEREQFIPEIEASEPAAITTPSSEEPAATTPPTSQEPEFIQT